MALVNLTPSNRVEAILDGQDITPVTRREYFLKQAVGSGGGGASGALDIFVDYNGDDFDILDDAGNTYTYGDLKAAYDEGKLIVISSFATDTGEACVGTQPMIEVAADGITGLRSYGISTTVVDQASLVWYQITISSGGVVVAQM